MKDYFNPHFFYSNRQNFKSKTDGLTVLSANQLVLKSSDESYDFYQDPNFWYLTGLEYAGLILVITKQEEFLILPKTSKSLETFDGKLDKSLLANKSLIKNIFDHQVGMNHLKSLVQESGQINTLLPLKRNKLELNTFPNPSRNILIKKIKSIKKDLKLVNLNQIFMDLRAIKSEDEIKAINEAVVITNNAIDKVVDLINQDKLTSAYQVAYKLDYLFKTAHANGHAFSPIVANTRDATTIHFRDLNQTLQKNNLIVIDVGADFHNYKADITRTISYGNVPARQKEVLESVKRAQSEALKMLKPKVTFFEIQQKVEESIFKELISLKILKSKDVKGIKEYFPHAFGHSLGLETHDFIDYKKPLAPNMVITMEPGIYLKEENIAVRIEDDVLITEDGYKILGHTKGLVL